MYTAAVMSIVERVASVLAAWGLAILLLGWAYLGPAWRRALALVLSAAGILCLVLAMNTEGLRESATVTGFLLGSQQVTEPAAASASLPYYVATGVCLLLGTAGLAVRDETARRISSHWLASAVVLSLLVTALRFALEKVAAPRPWTYTVGITWLAPIVGGFFVLNLRREGRGFRRLAGALVRYAYAARGAVFALMLVASLLRLGSHYDVTAFVALHSPVTGRPVEFAPGSPRQLLWIAAVPQLVFWPVFTVVMGFLGAALAWLGSLAALRRRTEGVGGVGEPTPDGEA